MIQWIFSDREQGFEAKYAHDQETVFRMHARRDHLFGLWAGTELGYTAQGAEDYAATLVSDDVHPAEADAILARVTRDLAGRVSEESVRRHFLECELAARREIAAPAPAAPAPR